MTSPDITKTALEIAARAAKVSLDHFRTSLNIEFKADESPVTRADRATEQAVRDMIAINFPDDGIFGEEHGTVAGKNDTLWVIDPIDGTRSFITGNPLFGFLLARLVGGLSELSIVALPALHETYLATRGGGAWLGKTRLNTSAQTNLDDCALYVNEGEKIWRDNPERFGRLMSASRIFRFGYDCYPYAQLAAGHIDGVVDFGLQPYDYLAVGLLVTEAGGVITDWQGNPPGMENDTNIVAAASPELHEQLLALLTD